MEFLKNRHLLLDNSNFDVRKYLAKGVMDVNLKHRGNSVPNKADTDELWKDDDDTTNRYLDKILDTAFDDSDEQGSQIHDNHIVDVDSIYDVSDITHGVANSIQGVTDSTQGVTLGTHSMPDSTHGVPDSTHDGTDGTRSTPTYTGDKHDGHDNKLDKTLDLSDRGNDISDSTNNPFQSNEDMSDNPNNPFDSFYDMSDSNNDLSDNTRDGYDSTHDEFDYPLDKTENIFGNLNNTFDMTDSFYDFDTSDYQLDKTEHVSGVSDTFDNTDGIYDPSDSLPETQGNIFNPHRGSYDPKGYSVDTPRDPYCLYKRLFGHHDGQHKHATRMHDRTFDTHKNLFDLIEHPYRPVKWPFGRTELQFGGLEGSQERTFSKHERPFMTQDNTPAPEERAYQRFYSTSLPSGFHPFVDYNQLRSADNQLRMYYNSVGSQRNPFLRGRIQPRRMTSPNSFWLTYIQQKAQDIPVEREIYPFMQEKQFILEGGY